MRDFPPQFLWGSATSAHQVEGGNTNNDWWEWEHASGSPASEPSGSAIDHFHRYDDDFRLLASLGHNAHRISVEWSRIEPAPGRFSEAALDHYAEVLASLRRHGLTSFVTLHHKTVPRWFAAMGGWLAEGAVDLFGRYADVVAERLGDRIDYACTINEPQIVAVFGYATGQMPPARTDRAAAEQVNRTLMLAHRRAVTSMRRASPATRTGVCLQVVPLRPHRPDRPGDVEATDWLRRVMIEDHLGDLRSGGDVGDFVGVQYYTEALVDSTVPELLAFLPSADDTTTQMGWGIHPAGFGRVLRLAAGTGLPLVVTENGIATEDDEQRLRFLFDHLSELKRVLDEGIDVRGYLYWSAFDNYEWNHGFRPRFGLVGVERADGFRRRPRPSAVAFGEMARTGRLACLVPPAQAGRSLVERPSGAI